MPLPKPGNHLNWTEGNPSFSTITVEPGSGKKLAGYGPDEQPASENLNWILYELDQWDKYFESLTDSFITQLAGLNGFQQIYAAIVGPVGIPSTHQTLAAALASSQVVAGSKVLVLAGTYTIATTIQLTKNDVEIVNNPGVIYARDGGTLPNTCMQITAARAKWSGGRFLTWPKAIQVDPTSAYARIYDTNFNACTVEVDDQTTGSATLLSGNITE